MPLGPPRADGPYDPVDGRQGEVNHLAGSNSGLASRVESLGYAVLLDVLNRHRSKGQQKVTNWRDEPQRRLRRGSLIAGSTGPDS
jgi:hypothetical protein